jgi:hypothetical protein
MATKQAADDEAARVETIEQSAKQDATVLSLKSMTSQQLDDWFTANITTLANARALLKILFKIVIRKVL